jgi:multiple antibiotic resistance protein
MSLISAIILLFLVLDPLGNIPVFLTILAHVDSSRRMRIIIRDLIFALLVLLVFMLAGNHIVAALQLQPAALTISGGVVLFIIALRMIFPSDEGLFRSDLHEEPFIVPLAIPLVAGPSALATVLLLIGSQPHLSRWLLALVIAWAASALLLIVSSPLSRVLGTRGLVALERLMGMLLTTVAIQMLLNGCRMVIPGMH